MVWLMEWGEQYEEGYMVILRFIINWPFFYYWLALLMVWLMDGVAEGLQGHSSSHH